MIIGVRNNRTAVRWVIAVVGALVLSGCGTVPTQEDEGQTGLQPDPALSPAQVVAIQVEALGVAPSGMEGIEIAFRFAGPANRASTGPVQRFARMLQGPVYGIMLDYDSVQYGPVIVQGRVALQQVTITRDEEVAHFVFRLYRQESDPYRDCWMTDGVFRIPSDRNQKELQDLPDPLSV